MRKLHFFLLLFSGALSFGTLCTALNEIFHGGTCKTSLTQQDCTATNDSTSDFLMCVGIPSDPGAVDQQILSLKGLIDALLDVFVYLDVGLRDVPLQNADPGWSFNSTALLQDDDVIRMWLQIRLTPVLSTISQNFLTCLGYNNFSCQTYQTVVQELSTQFSSLDSQRQQWIYSNFMQPFLSSTTPSGCVLPGDSTEDWLTKNFGSFSVLAQLREFNSINGLFSGLDVLHLLSPEQKAELMLYPETFGLNNESLSVVLGSLLGSLTPSGDVNTSIGAMWDSGLPFSYSSSPQDPLTQTVNGFMTVFSPVGSFVREFVSLTHQQDLSSMRSATLIQAMLNWTLAELAAPYKNISNNQQMDQTMFNPTDVNSWFTHVVVPILNTYLSSDIPAELTAVFHNVFHMENSVNKTQDTCSVTLDGACAVANVMEHVAKILQCASRTNLTLTEETVTSLVLHISSNLNTLLNQLAHTNFSSEDSPFRDILDQIHDPRHVDLRDAAFVTTWFHIKLKPLLPTLTPEYLLCLSAKPFSCQTFQILVQEMSNNMYLMTENGTRLVYKNFIFQFLYHQNSTGACMSNSSFQWIKRNLGEFSQFATVQEMYLLNPAFDALEAFNALTLNQIAEIIIEDLPGLTDKEQLINIVFSNILTSQTLLLPQLVLLISEMNMMKNNCLIYTEMFVWLHFTSLSTNPETDAVTLSSINNLIKATPAACASYSGRCNITAVTDMTVCNGVNSSDLVEYLNEPHNGSQLCSFNITQYACAQLTDLSAVDLVTVLSCNLNGNNTISEGMWKLFILSISPTIGPALDLFTNTTFQQSRPLVVMLDIIGDVTFSFFSPLSFTNSSFIQLWFGQRLHPFLPYVSPSFLSCLSKKNFSCDTYQNVVEILSQQSEAMSIQTQMSVYVYFIHTFLSSFNRTAGCSAGVQSSDWLIQNFGAFAGFATLSELQSLNPSLLVMDILGSLSLSQLVQVSNSPELISTPAQVTQVMNNIPASELGLFFTQLSTTLTVGGVSLSPVVSEAFLQEVFTRVNLGDPMMSDSEVEQWINVRLQPFISSIQTSQIPLYFSMITQRSCNISQQGVALLNSAHSNFSTAIQRAIINQLLISLKGPLLMKCYTNNSYYVFLQSYFMEFQFPTLSTFLSLMPPGHMAELLNSISAAQMSQFLNNNGTVDQQTALCELFNNYNQTENYLQSVPVLSSALASQTLQCVWPQAISATSQADVDRWFDVTLVQYLPYISFQMINSTQMSGASCLAFRKFVSLMGSYNFGKASFTKEDIYATIQSYLTTANPPKCYNTTDPLLSSTAWFYQYIRVFITFITVDNLQQFGGTKLQQFTPDAQNLELFRKNNVSQDVISAYSNMLFDAMPDFSILFLPKPLWCSAPASAFSNLSQSDVVNITKSLQQQCTNIDPTVSAALSSNVDTLTPDTIMALGNSITGVSVGQITACSPSSLLSSIGFLSSVVGWSQSQAMAIIQSLLSAGLLKITSVGLLQQLGTLLMGVPSELFSSISAASLLSALQSPTFLSNVVTTPIPTQQIIVNQIISVNSTPDSVVQNVPENMTPLIPRPSLLLLSQQTATILNQKQWTSDQAALFFDVVANQFSNADNISFQVLQGFTCTRVQMFSTQKVKNLIRGCRRRGNRKVTLQESQLTCMYNYIKHDTVTSFSDYPADMLLYYNLSQVQPSLCQSYYSALGGADFSVFSPTLAFRRNTLFMNARQCLGVSGLRVNQTQLDVMGQMVCVFNSAYILNSDPYVLEKLKLCNTLTPEQSSAVENVLLSGNTIYGAPASWNQTTLTALDDLPLYLSSNFWAYFTQKEKLSFLRGFVAVLKNRGVSRMSISNLITRAGSAPSANTRSLLRFKRDTDTACTVGEITQVQASDASFPFGYDVNQFNVCLSVQTLKDNLAAVTDKATGSDYQTVILYKLNQAYPAGISDQVLQVIGPASRAASTSDISKWNVTSIVTLSALMRSYDGDWSPEQVRAIVSRYLTGNRSLGTLELNALGGTNLCALNTSMLNTISATSLQLAGALQVSNCSMEQKQVLFSISQVSFNDQTLSKSTQRSATVSLNSYQLIKSYLGGANLSYVRTLAISNVSMDLLTFITLDPNVVNNLTVSEVQGLLGANLPDLKTYENNTVVNNWITRQLQTDLNTLGLDLTGGRTGTTPTTASAPANATANATATSATSNKPTAAGSSISTSSGLEKLLLILGVTMATLQLIH
ncbi:uncharacterized protein LOC132839126 [Tachysurus vachellii]|uniref:uncharacterized protein LOC132839126 n=1 Tax=Tachysurus vachellii TaxID=175792 RepID=UPI00296B5098|nr:uncharacterized protein LOC132839126 [Tachysurus vachellii]